MNNRLHFARLALITLLMGLLLVTIGAFVRSSGSGLGCPDWPRCHGSWIPPRDASAIIEYSHRLAASILGLLSLVLLVWALAAFRRIRSIFLPALGIFIVIGVQAWIGRLVVLQELPRNLVALHFFTAMTVIGLLTVLAVNARYPQGGSLDRTTWYALISSGAIFAAMMAGAFVSQFGAALAFPDWPLMNGGLLPDAGARVQEIHWLHRALVLLSGLGVGWLAVHVTRRKPKDRIVLGFTHLAATLWLGQVVVGALNIFTSSAMWVVVAHVGLAAALWSLAVAVAALAYRRSPSAATDEPAPTSQSSDFSGIMKAYFALTKPRIIELLLVTTVPSMVLAADGWPGTWLVLATVLGGSMSAGAANAINCYLDRDIDQLMRRTSRRPIPAHQVSPDAALIFGVGLGVFAFGWLAALVNLNAAAISTAALLFYVFVYTKALKRTTPSNIVIGGAAGAAPALVAWAAVTGSVGVQAWVLFAVIFYWTPPHFWALALHHSSEYRAAGVPMLPVVAGPAETHRQIRLYSWMLLGVGLLLAATGLGALYLIASTAVGLWFLRAAQRLEHDPRSAMRVFRASISYLTILFAAVAGDVFLHVALPDWVAFSAGAAGAIMFFVANVGVMKAVKGFSGGALATPSRQTLIVESVWTALPALAAGALTLAVILRALQ